MIASPKYLVKPPMSDRAHLLKISKLPASTASPRAIAMLSLCSHGRVRSVSRKSSLGHWWGRQTAGSTSQRLLFLDLTLWRCKEPRMFHAAAIQADLRRRQTDSIPLPSNTAGCTAGCPEHVLLTRQFLDLCATIVRGEKKI